MRHAMSGAPLEGNDAQLALGALIEPCGDAVQAGHELKLVDLKARVAGDQIADRRFEIGAQRLEVLACQMQAGQVRAMRIEAAILARLEQDFDRTIRLTVHRTLPNARASAPRLEKG